MSSPLIHIGYHKTASTWLQREVFPEAERAEEISYVAGPHHRHLDLHRLFFEINSFAYCEERVRSVLDPGIREAEARNVLPVISHERFSGAPYSGGHDSKQSAERLYTLFPNARILIVIREQSDMLLSMYKQYIQAGGGASFGQFVTPRSGAGSIASFRLDYLEYEHLISHYYSLFGEDHVLVLPYEILLHDPHDFLDRIRLFCGAEMGPATMDRRKQSLSAAALYAARRGNQLFALTGLNPAPHFPIKEGYKRIKKMSKRLDKRLPPAIRRKADEKWRNFAIQSTKGHYRESNLRTQDLLNDDLASLGYTL